MLEIRTTLHLAVRLTMRSIMVIENSGAASEGTGAWRVALPCFMVLDVVVWPVLRRSDRFGLSWRLPLDSADAAFWTMSPEPARGAADLALFLVIPLAVEAGVRMGLRAMIVPAAVLVSTTAGAGTEAKHLQVALLEWARAHNAHPDLSGLVELHIDEDHGTTLLSAGQVEPLRRALDGLGLRKRVTVKVLRSTERLPGEELPLDVNGTTVVVPADGQAAPPPLDLAAVPYFYVAILMVAWLLPTGGSVPAPFVATGLAACAAGGLIAHRQAGAPSMKAQRGLLLAVAVSTVVALVHSTATDPITLDGNPNLGFNVGVLLLAFTAGFYWDTLGPWRWLAPAAVGGITVLAVALFPVPSEVDARSVIAAVIGALYPFFPCRHLTSALRRVSAQHARTTQDEDEDAVRAAFLEGRESVVGLVRQARLDALAQLERMGPALDAGLGRLAALRLEEVDRRLRALDP